MELSLDSRLQNVAVYKSIANNKSVRLPKIEIVYVGTNTRIVEISYHRNDNTIAAILS